MLSLSIRTVLALLWLVRVSSPALTECPADGTDPEYQLDFTQTSAAYIYSSAGSLRPLYRFAQLFLQAVQPYGLPLDTAFRALRSEAGSSEVIPYEAGYVVCLILAALYIGIIPTVGAVLVWRHFHRKNVSIQSPSPSTLPWHQRNIIVIPCLSVVVILLFSGVILTFTTNNRMRQNMQPNLSHLSKDLGDVENALSSISQKEKSITEKFSILQEELMNELNETGDLIGQTILSSLDSKINVALNSLDTTVKDATGAQRHLLEVKETRQNMQTVYSFLKRELNETRNRLNNLDSTLNTSTLETDANYDMIPSVDDKVQQMSFVSAFNGMNQQFETSLSSFPGNCTNQSTPQMEELQVYLNETHGVFRNYSKWLPSLNSLSKAVSDIRASLNRSSADIEYYDYVRWSVSVMLCTLILIITLLMLAGLVIGASVVISPTLYPPYLQDQLRLTAVYLLYIASGMIFIFSWLFIIMVFINLFLGGNIYAMTCRSCTNGEIYKFLDEQDLFSSLSPNKFEDSDISAASAQNPNVSTGNNTTDQFTDTTLDFSTFEIFQGCRMGRSMFYSMHMDKIFSMDTFLNINMYLTGVNYSLQALSFDLTSVQLLPNNAKSAVQQFRDSSILNQIKYDDFRQLLARPIVKTDLDTFAAQLENAALTANATIRENLTSEAAKVRQLANTVRLQDSYRLNMSSNIEALSNISKSYQMNAGRTLLSVSEVESSLQPQVPYAVQNVSQCMMERAAELMRQYFDFVRYGIIDEALDCSWLPVYLSNMYTAACENLIEPWNAFWLCLGWCCAFLVPGVIFSILAARQWKHPPTSSANRAPFYMPDDIIDKDSNNTYMTLDSLKDKRKDGDTVKNNIYMTLEEVIGRKAEGDCSTK